MHAIYDLREKLCKELEGYGERGELSASILDTVDKLAHAIKNMDKIIESYEMEDDRDSYRGSYRMEESYRRGRGRNARRDTRGRYAPEYSRASDDMVMQLRDMMEDAPDHQTRQEIERLIKKMEA